ncbi:MAG: carbon starvation CstA family protein, partial [Cellulosilyticaceae bacterium]
DTATRLGRYMFQELCDGKQSEETVGHKKKNIWQNTVVATAVTVGCAILLLAYGYQNIWPIFGASNQLLAGLALLGLTAWFAKTKRGLLPTLIPMIFMFIVTLTALGMLIYSFFMAKNIVLLVIAVILFVLAIVLIVTTAQTFSKEKKQNKKETLEHS